MSEESTVSSEPILFRSLRSLLVATTGKGYDRAPWLNDLHHKLAYRLHKALPKLGITGLQRVTVPSLNGKHMYVRAEDGGVAHQILMYQEYEPYETSLVKEKLKPEMVVYNIGANLGYYVLVASDCVGPTGKVFAFEPEPRNVELLRRTITENAIVNVEVLAMAVAAEPGSATLSLSSTNSGDHQLRNVADREGIRVPVVSIDSLIAAGHPAPDAIIMDVQGSELDVLRGAKAFLASSKLKILFTEFWPKGLDERHPNGAKETLWLIEQAALTFYAVDEKGKNAKRTTAEEVIARTKGNTEANLMCLLPNASA